MKSASLCKFHVPAAWSSVLGDKHVDVELDDVVIATGKRFGDGVVKDRMLEILHPSLGIIWTFEAYLKSVD